MIYIVLFFSLMFIACGEVDEGKVPSDRPDPLEQEFYYNYRLLKAYFYRPDSIKDYSEYGDLTEVDSMYSSLNDYLKGWRYTRYYKPDTADNVFQGLVSSEKYYSFGFERGVEKETLTIDDEVVTSYTLVVTDVYPFSPATDAGLKKYDKLLSANGVSLAGITDTNLVKIYLRSDTLFESTTVFEVLRGTESKSLPAMEKKEVREPTVFLDSVRGIPYIFVTRFTQETNNPQGTYFEFKEYLNEIKGAKTAIIDLRYNPGGTISHCTAMAAELVPLNSELVYDEVHYQNGSGKNVVENQHYYARDYLNGKGAGTDIKWIILMSRGSASCSERFIAAVKYNRPSEVILVGENSYGKGIGQVYGYTILEGLFNITALQSYYPDGRTFHLDGIPPDIDVNPTDNDALINAIEIVARHFDPGMALAKRSVAPAKPDTMPPVRKSKKTDFEMYHLLHEWK